MARYKNSVSLIGVAGKDAELRTTNTGVPYARFSLATSTGGYTKQDGTVVPEQTQWHNIVCFRKQADFAGKFVKKGMKVSVDGMIIYGSYQNQQGQAEKTCDIVANDNGIILMTRPDSMGKAQRPQAQAPQPQSTHGGYQKSYAQGHLNGYQRQNNGAEQPNYQQQGGYSQQAQKPQDTAFPFDAGPTGDCPY